MNPIRRASATAVSSRKEKNVTQGERALIAYGILLVALSGIIRWKLSWRLLPVLPGLAGAALLAGDLLYVYD